MSENTVVCGLRLELLRAVVIAARKVDEDVKHGFVHNRFSSIVELRSALAALDLDGEKFRR